MGQKKSDKSTYRRIKVTEIDGVKSVKWTHNKVLDEDDISYWDYDDSREVLWFSCIVEAFEDWVGSVMPYESPPEDITLLGFRRKELPKVESYAEKMLEILDEMLYEEHGDPDDSGISKFTDKQKSAANDFVRIFFSDYDVWCCEVCCEVTVDVRKFAEAHEVSLS